MNANREHRVLGAKSVPRIAVVGLGRQGQEHLRAASALAAKGTLTLCGVCDADRNLADENAMRLEVPGYSEPSTMIAVERPDAVIVSVPHKAHHQIATDALRQGVHVLKEKPFALSRNQALELGRIAVMTGVKLRIAQQRRFHPYFRQALAWAPTIGTVRFLDYQFCLNDRRASWYSFKAEGGGCWNGLGWHGCWALPFFDVGIENTSLRTVAARRRQFEGDADDTCFFSGSGANGVMARMFLSVAHPEKREDLYIQAEMGSIRITRNSVELFAESGDLVAADRSIYNWSQAYEDQITDFLSDVAGETPAIDPSAWRCMDIYHSAMQSAENYGTPSIVHPRNEVAIGALSEPLAFAQL